MPRTECIEITIETENDAFGESREDRDYAIAQSLDELKETLIKWDGCLDVQSGICGTGIQIFDKNGNVVGRARIVNSRKEG